MCDACVQEEEEWNLIEETGTHEAAVPVKTPTDNQSHAYTLDADGATVENIWESMSYAELRQVRYPTCLVMWHVVSVFYPLSRRAMRCGCGSRPGLHATRLAVAITPDGFEQYEQCS